MATTKCNSFFFNDALLDLVKVAAGSGKASVHALSVLKVEHGNLYNCRNFFIQSHVD